jgi:hypothetical protein
VELRLPGGWTRREEIGPFTAAFGDDPRAVILHAATDSAVDSAELGRAYDECLVLDESAETCRGEVVARRILSCYRHEGRSLTAEHWSVPGHVFTAIVPTLHYASLAPALHRVLKTFPGKGYGRPLTLGRLTGQVELPVSIHGEPGQVLADHDRGLAAVLLPGLAAVRTVPADLVPAWLAAGAGLGPRPGPPPLGKLLGDPVTIERALAGDTAGLPGKWATALSTVALSEQRRLVLGTREIIDCGSSGLWWIDGSEQVKVLAPVSMTEFWRWLTATLARHARCDRS